MKCSSITIKQWPPIFLAPGLGFMEDNSSTDQERGQDFRMIQVRYTDRALYLYFVAFSGYFTLTLGLGFVLLWEPNAAADLIGGGAWVVKPVMGSSCQYRWSFAHMPTAHLQLCGPVPSRPQNSTSLWPRSCEPPFNPWEIRMGVYFLQSKGELSWFQGAHSVHGEIIISPDRLASQPQPYIYSSPVVEPSEWKPHQQWGNVREAKWQSDTQQVRLLP